MLIHDVIFPQYHEHVLLERRTLFHMPIGAEMWAVGDRLRLIEHPKLPRCKVGVLVNVSQVYLLDGLDAVLAKLCVADRAEYLARWDALHSGLLSALNPVVWRIEFRYGGWKDDPPEWSLAA